MDTLFLYLLAAYSVACWISDVRAVGAGLFPGLAIRQGEPSSIIAQNKGHLLLNCSVEHESTLGPLNIVWRKDGEPIDVGKRVQVLTNGSLFFRRVIHRPKKTRSDEGRYTCVVTIGDVGSVIARSVDVKVAGIERKFDTEPQSQEVSAGGVARFECRIQAIPPAIYIWERNSTTLPQNEDRYTILNSGILQITDVRSGDAGQYRCYATQGSLHELPAEVDNIYGKFSADAQLSVTNGNGNRPVRIVANSRNVTALLGNLAVLECLVDGYDGTVIWRRQGQSEAVQTDGRVVRKGDNLRVLKTYLSDAGQYECVAGNVIATTLLRVIKAPVLVAVPTSERHPTAQWIYLQCKAEGHPEPRVTWLKDGEEIDYSLNSYRGKGNQLVIVHSDRERSGFYQCIASNEAGSVTAFARIDIYMQENVPDSPKNVRAENVTSTGFFLQWDPAKAKMCCPVVAYSVLYRKVGKQDFDTTDEVVIPNRLKVNELDPFSNYSVLIAAYSMNGAGHKSEPIIVQTKEDVPRKPVSISMEPRSTSIIVRWNELPPEDANGVIVEYRIFHKKLRTPEAMVQVETGIYSTARSYRIQDLEPSTEYGVRMLALTSVGFRAFPDVRWPWVHVFTGNGDSLPPAIQLVQVNATAMNVTWSSEVEKSVVAYSLQLRSLPATDNITVIPLPSHARYYVFHGLDENIQYEVTLVEQTLDDSSSAVAEFRTIEAPLPPVPRNLQVTLRTADSIDLIWIQPETTMEISHYTVKYSPWTDTGLNSQWKFFTSDQTSALLENLHPYTRYQLAVRAHTEHAATNYSTPISALTREGVPSEPQNIRVSTKQPGSVIVEWAPPAVANGNIKTYIILYTSNPENSDELWIHVTRNGSVRSAIITVEDRSGKLYYFKLQARTETGLGRLTNAVPINPSVVQTGRDLGEPDPRDDQRLGIIIGVSIGVFCIIICVLIILLRNRCFNTDYTAQPQTQVVRSHGNGHIPGSRLAPTDVPAENRHSADLYEMDAVTPMLEHVPENMNSDSKGGGNGSLILTPNGAKLNGFGPLLKNGIRNGQLPNGHMGYIAGHYDDGVMDMEERRGLIAAMLRGGDDHCITGPGPDDSLTMTRGGEDLGSLDDIDRSHEFIMDPTLTKSQDSSHSEQSGGSGSGSGSNGDRNSDGVASFRGTLPRSDTTDTGDTVIYLTSFTSGDRPVSESGESGSGSASTEHLSGTTIPRSLSDSEPADGGSRHRHTNDIRDAAHRQESSHVSRVALPQNYISTSNQPQVLRPAQDDHGGGGGSGVVGDSVRCRESRRDDGSGPEVTQGTGSSSYDDGGGYSHGHVHSNGEPRWGARSPRPPPPSQGDRDPVPAAYNPTIPHSPAGELPPIHQSGDVTLAEIPQDARRGKANSPKRPNHFKV